MTIPWLRCAMAALAIALAPPALAQTWPAKAVRVVVPYPPGGPYDIIGRVLGQRLGEATGQQFVVDNRAGANGIIGADAVAKAAPDGYTLLVGGIGPNAVNASLYAKVPYNAAADFTPVVEVIRSPNVLVVQAEVKAASVAELIALARADGKLNYGSAGAGSSTHLFAEMFRLAAKIELTHVPYKGDAPAITALLAGEVPMYFASATTILPHVRAGKVRALAVTGRQRLPALPNVPTVAEAAVPDYQATAWYGLFAPAGTPRAIVAALNEQVNRILQDAEVRKRLSGDGVAEIVGGTPESFNTQVQGEIERWRGVIRSARISAE